MVRVYHRAMRLSPAPVLVLSCFVVIGCASFPGRGPDQARPTHGAHRPAPGGAQPMGWGVQALNLGGPAEEGPANQVPLRVRLRHKGGATSAAVLAVPCGALHGAGFVALARDRQRWLETRVEDGATRVRLAVGRASTGFVVETLAPDILPAAAELVRLLSLERAGAITPDEVAAARAAVPREDLFPPPDLDLARLEGGCFRAAGHHRVPVLALAGPVTAERLVHHLSLPPPTTEASLPPVLDLPAMRSFSAVSTEPVFRLALPAPSPASAQGPATTLLAHVLSGDLGGRLADQAGLGQVAASHVAGPSGGYLLLEGEAGGELVEGVASLVEGLLQLQPEQIRMDELERARDVAKVGFSMGLLGRSDRTEVLARHALVEADATPGHHLLALKSATAEDLVREARRDRGGVFQLALWGAPGVTRLGLEHLPERWAAAARGAPPRGGVGGPEDGGWVEPEALRRERLPSGGVLAFRRDGNLPLWGLALRWPGGRCMPEAEEAAARALVLEAARIGLEQRVPAARMKAYQATDRDGFDLLVLEERAEEATDVLLEHLRHPRPEHLGRARLAMRRRALAAREDPREQARAAMLQVAFPGHPCGRASWVISRVAGSLSDERASAAATRLLRSPSRIALRADLTPEQARRRVSVWSRNAGSEDSTGSPERTVPAMPDPPRLLPAATDVMYVAVGHRLPPDSRVEAEVLLEILGLQLAERKASGIHPRRLELQGAGEAGLLVLETEAEPGREREAAGLLTTLLEELISRGVTARELDLARRRVALEGSIEEEGWMTGPARWLDRDSQETNPAGLTDSELQTFLRQILERPAAAAVVGPFR